MSAAEAPAVSDAVRGRLALALDVDDLVIATRLAADLKPWFGVAKVGLELVSGAGPVAVVGLGELGFVVFVVQNVCDIPSSVAKTARVLGSLGARYLTVHGFGGPVMCRAAADALAAGAAEAGFPPPTTLVVTVLTSDATAPPHVLGSRVQVALEARCGGIVCSAADLAEAKRLGPRLTAVVPGIRLPGAGADDQARVATPQSATAAGADLLVIGRTVTKAEDPHAAAAEVAEGVAAAL
jgi:orotidine-5'-phosphate decarboxylase